MGEVIRIGSVLESVARARAAAADRGEEFEASQIAEARRERLARLDHSGCRVTDIMRKAIAFELLDSTPARAALEAWAADHNRKPWLILSGGTGCGKSIAVAEAMARYRGMYSRADDIVRTFSSLWDSAAQQRSIRECRLLAIDDLGTEFEPERMQPALLDLLDARAGGAQAGTIVTTNLTRKAMSERYAHERILSRLSERAHWVTVPGPDLRRKKQ